MAELKIKLENLQCTLTDPVSEEDIRAAWFMVEEIIGEVAQIEGLRDLWIEYLTGACLYSDAGVEIPEELSGELDIGLPLARKICKALGGE